MRKIYIIFSIILVIITVSLLFYSFYKLHNRNIIEKFNENKRLINIYIAGSNIYNENTHKFHAILTLNTINLKIGLTLIPPEFMVNLDKGKKEFQRIDQVDMDDIKKLQSFLNHELKINIPFYIEIYSPDIVRLVDIIEGIDLFVLDQVTNIDGVRFGKNYFDGEKIIQYINSNNSSSIYMRYDRIRDILLTLFFNKEKYKEYIDIDLISKIFETFKTNFHANEIMSLSKLLLKGSEFICTVLPGRYNEKNFYYFDEIAYKIYENTFFKRIIYNKDDNTIVKIKILNGTGVSGLARKMRNMLVKEGINVVEFGTSPYPLMDHTIIINRKSDVCAYTKVSELLGVDRIYHIIDSIQLNNVLVIIGKDFI